MKKIVILLLIVSGGLNAWLLANRDRPLKEVEARPAVSVAKPVAADPALDPAILKQLDTANLAELRDTLRAAGVDESSIRGLLEGTLRRRHAVQMTRRETERARAASDQSGAAISVAPLSLRAAVNDPLRELLGVDPLDLADAEARYDFLPPEKRRLLAAIDVDYTDLRARTPRAARTAGATRTELDEQTLLNAERRKDLIAALTPEERTEYDLRFSGTSPQNARRLAAMGVTEAEFRSIKPIIDRHAVDQQALPPARDAPNLRAEADQKAIDQLVEAIGFDRAVEYLWTDAGGPHRSTSDVLRDLGLPTTNAARLLQLAAETAARAAAIHHDTTLSVEQKRAALATLQRGTKPQLDALIPPAAQSKLPDSAIDWYKPLSEGKYIPRRPQLRGAGYSVSPPVAIDSPVTGPPPVFALARARPQ